MRGADGGRRALERDLARDPGDAQGWVRLSRARLRAGERREAVEVALRAAGRQPQASELRAWLAELGCGEGPWPGPRGPERNAQRAPVAGPARGVLRWRAALPRRGHGAAVVDLSGRASLRVEPAGLVRVAADGREVEWVCEDWPVDLAPLLLGGEPAGWDPVLHDLTVAPRVGAARWWSAARAPGALRLGLGPRCLEASAPGGELLWRVPLAHPQDVVAGPEGPIYAALAEPELTSTPFDSPGRVVALERTSGRVLASLGQGRSLCGDGQLAVSLGAGGELLVQLGMDLSCLAPGGALRWRHKLEWAAPPALGDETVVVASPMEGLCAYDLTTGERRWRLPELRTARAPLVDGDGVVHVVGAEGWIAAVAPEGRPRFVLRPAALGGPLGPPALGPDGTLFVAAGDELLAVA